MMDFEEIEDFANKADKDVGRFFIRDVNLSPERLLATDFEIDVMKWNSISYMDEKSYSKIPSDKRGIYAFGISVENKVFPPNSLIMYIGIAGRKSDRSLRDRFRDYCSKSKILERPKINRMIANWRHVLLFFYAPVEDDVTSETLEKFEEQLAGSFMPAMGSGDLEIELKKSRRAF